MFAYLCMDQYVRAFFSLEQEEYNARAGFSKRRRIEHLYSAAGGWDGRKKERIRWSDGSPYLDEKKIL